MSTMAASIGAHPGLFTMQVIQVDHTWHRRVRLGAFGWWQPEGCPRLAGDAITATRPDPPGGGVMCPVCWPVWPKVGR